jgi:hypothetical protein
MNTLEIEDVQLASMYMAIQCSPSRLSGFVFLTSAEGAFNCLGNLFLAYTPLNTNLVPGILFYVYLRVKTLIRTNTWLHFLQTKFSQYEPLPVIINVVLYAEFDCLEEAQTWADADPYLISGV